MLQISERVSLLEQLGRYIKENSESLQMVKERASGLNRWFTQAFTDLALNNIADYYLAPQALQLAVSQYKLSDPAEPKLVGITMAGNIPAVGFHDWMCTFLTGHRQADKLSSKDEVLMRHFMDKMTEWNPEAAAYFSIQEGLKGCDAYIATGSNNSSRYFEYYFSRFPHIIRKNKTSVAILTGTETQAQLEALADDVYLFFGLGCRNVTKIMVPENYDFVPLLDTFRKYDYLADENKYKNNYDYQLALLILNKVQYMANESILLTENPANFSGISVLHYEYYSDFNNTLQRLQQDEDIQCIVSNSTIPFGKAQQPGILDFADGADTLAFLSSL